MFERDQEDGDRRRCSIDFLTIDLNYRFLTMTYRAEVLVSSVCGWAPGLLEQLSSAGSQ
jgi:hypothetical protein